MNSERDFVTEVELGEEIAGFFTTFNTEHWMSNLRYYAEEAGWDSTIGCRHERGAFNDRAVEAHAERGIEIERTWFCFDCGTVLPAEEAKPRVHPPAPEQNFRDMVCDTDVTIVGADGRSFVANLDPNRVDYVTPDGVEVWMERKRQKVRFLDAFGNQVGPVHANVVPAVIWATLNGWRDPSAPDWWNDQAYEQTKASAAGELGAWEGGWTDRPEAWVK
jgi:hypothetical protein